MKNENKKSEFKVVCELNQIPPHKRKLVMLSLLFLNEAGNRKDAIKLIRNQWVRKLYPLPRTFHRDYNSQKSVRSNYWRKINNAIDEYIIELPID